MDVQRSKPQKGEGELMSDTTSETEAGPSPQKEREEHLACLVPDNDSIMADELGILIGGVGQRPLDCGVYLRGI